MFFENNNKKSRATVLQVVVIRIRTLERVGVRCPSVGAAHPHTENNSGRFLKVVKKTIVHVCNLLWSTE